MSIPRLKKTLISESSKICIFYQGVISYIWLKIWIFLTLFFVVQIVQKEFSQTFLTQKTFSTLQISWYLEVEKFALFAKGLVHDFNKKSEVFLISLFSAKLLKRVFGNVLNRKRAFLDYKNVDFRRLQNCHFLPSG